MKKVLITGKNSFIGTCFRNMFHDQFRIEEACLVENKPEEIDFSGYDVVFHVAAIVHSTKQVSRETYFRVNSDLAVEAAEHAKKAGVTQFVFMSTVKVYGEYTEPGKPWTETSECHPVDPYGESKLDAEKRLNSLNNEEFKVSILRTPVVYGPGVKGNIGSLLKLTDKLPWIPLGNIPNKRCFIYSGNLISLIYTIIRKDKPGIFLAAENNGISTTSLVTAMANEFGNKKIIPLPGIARLALEKIKPSVHQRLFGYLELDNSLTRERLAFSPPYTLEQGIRETVHWYLNQKK